MKESQVQTSIKKALVDLGGWQYTEATADFITPETAPFWIYDLSQPRATKQTPGIPDLLLIGFGRQTWVEVKRAGTKRNGDFKYVQRPSQYFFEDVVEMNNGHLEVWRSAADAVAWVNRMKAL